MGLEGEGRVWNLEAMGVHGLCPTSATVISKAIVVISRTKVANLHRFLLAKGYLVVVMSAWSEGIRGG